MSLRWACFSADATRFLFHPNDSLHVFDTATGRQLHKFAQPSRRRLVPSRSRNHVIMGIPGKRIKTPLANGLTRWSIEKKHAVVLVDASSGKEVFRQDGLAGSLGPVACTLDGRLIATAPRRLPTEILVWGIDGELRHTFVDFQGAVSSLEFSADGRRLASGMSDTSILIWKLPIRD